MKNLFFITSTNHVDQIKIFADCISKTTTLKDFDLVLHVNTFDTDINTVMNYFRLLPNKNKSIIFTTKNCGYNLGPMEALGDNYSLFSDYDNVIHIHPDVFPADENKFLEILQNNHNIGLLVNYSMRDRHEWMSTDLFVFRPKYTFNFFRNWVNYINVPWYGGAGFNGQVCCEQFLYHESIKNDISHVYIPRFENNHHFPRVVCNWGFLHEHDLVNAKNVLGYNEQ